MNFFFKSVINVQNQQSLLIKFPIQGYRNF